MPLSNVTTSQLYEAIARIGPAQAAEEGYFHALPCGGGGTSPTNVRMLKKTNTQAGDLDRAFITFDNLGLSSPFTVTPFLQTTILTPVSGYSYDANIISSVDFVAQSITYDVRWYWDGAGDNPNTGGNFDIGLRVEPFVLST